MSFGMEEYICEEIKYEIPSRTDSASTPRVSTKPLPWERHPFLNYIRKRWAFITKNVTRPGFERFISRLPKAALAFLVFALLGSRFISQYPFGKRLFAKIVALWNKRFVQFAVKGTAALTASFLAVCAYTYYKVYIQWRPHRDPTKKDYDNRPFLAFGGAGLLYPFYWGVIAYAKDHFDVSDVRTSGLSAGLFTVGSVMTDNQMEIWEMVMHVMQRITDEFDSFLCIEGTTAAEFSERELKLLGWTDKKMQDLSDGNRFYSSVSEVEWAKFLGIIPYPYLKCRVLEWPRTLKELGRIIVATCNIPPLVGTPLCLQPGKWAWDGALASSYALPADTNPDKVLRVTPVWLVPHDICMPFAAWFHCWHVLFPADAATHEELFVIGYETAKKHHNVFIDKGFEQLEHPEADLSHHLRTFKNIPNLSTQKRDLRQRRDASLPPELDNHDRTASPVKNRVAEKVVVAPNANKNLLAPPQPESLGPRRKSGIRSRKSLPVDISKILNESAGTGA